MKKEKYFICNAKKNMGGSPEAEIREGYTLEIAGIKFGVTNKDSNGNKTTDWAITELSTGFAVGFGKTRKEAVEHAKANIDGVKKCLEDPGIEKYREIIKNANAKLDKLSEFTELPTKVEPPKVTDKCYATEPTKNNNAITNVGEVIEEKTEFKVKSKSPVHPKSLFKETDKNKRVKEMVGKLEDGVKEIFTSGKYEHYLSIMSKFHRYSLNNNLLIAMQMPTATRVAGYGDWQKKFNRQVRKGEKGIQILGGFPSKRTITDENGEEKEIHFMRYKPVSVFDISQTDGEDLPEICHTIKGDVSGYDSLVAKLRKVSPVKIEFEDINNGSNGYYHLADKRIAIKSGMSQAHTIKTMVHEIAHSILHDKDNGNEKEANRQTMEVQAESVAYVVNQYLGLDTSDYSFGYIAGWGEGKEMKELKESLEVIRKTSDEIIKQIA